MEAASDPHPDVRRTLELLAEADVLPLASHGSEGAREVYDSLRPDVEGPEVGAVGDRTVPGYDGGEDVPVRIYRPDGAGPFPAIVYFHGGGFVVGGLESHDLVCRHLATRNDAVVVSVDYRLAPEHPFPAALEDAYAATRWAAEHPSELDGDGNLVVMGDSAGGNLAAAVSLLARDRGGPAIDYQVLVYPGVSGREDWDSVAAFDEGYSLEAADLAWFNDCYYASDLDRANPYACPLEAADHADLPPATVLTAGFDPLRDQGAAYAGVLAAAGVPVAYRNYEDLVHGFFTMLAGPGELAAAHEAHGDVAEDLANALS